MIYLGLDIELSGLDKDKCGIIQIGAWATGESEDHFKGYFLQNCNPQLVGKNHKPKEILFVEESMKVNGLSKEGVDAAPPMFEALTAFVAYLKRFKGQKIVCVGSNIGSDIVWLQKALHANGFDKNILGACTDIGDMSETLFGKHMGLNRLAGQFGIKNGDAHDALADAYISNKVYHRMKQALFAKYAQFGDDPSREHYFGNT